MEIKTYLKMFLILLPVLVVLLFSLLGYSEDKGENSTKSPSGWAWSLGSVWMSGSEIPDLNANNWFYMLKAGKIIVAGEVDYNTGNYSVYYNLGKGNGWELLNPPIPESDLSIGVT